MPHIFPYIDTIIDIKYYRAIPFIFIISRNLLIWHVFFANKQSLKKKEKKKKIFFNFPQSCCKNIKYKKLLIHTKYVGLTHQMFTHC